MDTCTSTAVLGSFYSRTCSTIWLMVQRKGSLPFVFRILVNPDNTRPALDLFELGLDKWLNVAA